jgi:two-component system, cell cycle response regulator
LVEASAQARLLRALDMGVNDDLTRPIDKVRADRARAHAIQAQTPLRLSALAVTDALTGLSNRRYMEAHLRALGGTAVRAGQPLSVVLVDVANFKAINDTWGHAAGDAILRELAARCRAIPARSIRPVAWAQRRSQS